MSKIVTAGRRHLKNDVWHDDNGPIAGFPDQWDPAMTDAEIELAALSDPDNPPTRPDQPMRRIALVRSVRQRLGMSVDDFARAYGIPPDVIRAWERHEISPTAAEMSFLKAIQQAPDAVREALAPA